ncbi:hypothetical protein HPP92_003921 [Vanilla planifolia]|uniref:Cytochrome P450 71A1 n=1 Tax=Vanilla planifolia TaxID=51239 RepID=A0A835S2Q7_VANPL|nr:hypothetical protein HPP92_003921 [Vanilla planifolia]
MDMAPIFLSLLAILTILLTSLRLRRSQSQNLPPSPPSFPVIGHLQLLSPLLHRSIHHLSKDHGPIFLLRLGSVPAIFLSSAELAKEAIKTREIDFATRPPSSVVDRLGYGTQDVAFAPYGPYWRRARSACVLHLLSPRRVRAFGSVREEEVALLLSAVRAAGPSPVNLSAMLIGVTNDIICRVALGRKYRPRGRDLGEMLKEMGACLHAFPMKDFVPWLGWVDRITGFNARVERCFEMFDEFLEEVLEDHLVGRGSDRAAENADFVDVLLSLKEQDEKDGGFDLGRDSLKAIIVDMFVAGTDTILNTLEWTMAELVRHPVAMRRATEEVRRRRPDVKEEKSVDQTTDYLNAVVKETLRLHPPFPMLVPRAARRDTELSGYKVPANTTVFINAWAIARDPEYWKRPEEFWPERFLDDGCGGGVDYRGQCFHFIPFGAGRRSCPGIEFSLVTITCVMENLLRWFDWEPAEERKEDVLDMTECRDINVHKKFPLILTAKPWIEDSYAPMPQL